MIAVAGPLVPDARGPQRSGGQRGDDAGAHRPRVVQPVRTAVVTQRHLGEGRDVVGQPPLALRAAEADGHETAPGRDEQRAAGRHRLLACQPPPLQRQRERQRPARVGDLGRQWEADGQVPQAQAAVAHSVWTVVGRRWLAGPGTPGVSASAGARHRPCQLRWRARCGGGDGGARPAPGACPPGDRPLSPRGAPSVLALPPSGTVEAGGGTALRARAGAGGAARYAPGLPARGAAWGAHPAQGAVA